jgi:hypothetical protein
MWPRRLLLLLLPLLIRTSLSPWILLRYHPPLLLLLRLHQHSRYAQISCLATALRAQQQLLLV